MANVRKDLIPDWRKGAKYHRALLDADGLVNGREVCVYKDADLDAVLCEGQLGCDHFDHAYFYDTLGEAVRAAEKWDGNGAPQGKWTDYRSRNNGDVLPTPKGVRHGSPEMRSVLGSLMDSSHAMDSLGTSAAEASAGLKRMIDQGLLTHTPKGGLPKVKIARPKAAPTRTGQGSVMVTVEAGDDVVVSRDMAHRQIHVELKRLEGKPLEQITYEALLEMDGAHGVLTEPGTRLRMMEVGREKVLKPPGQDWEAIHEVGREDPAYYLRDDGTILTIDEHGHLHQS